MTDFAEHVDLAARRLGGMVVAANDEFFAPKENLLEPLPAVFDPLAYTDRGKLMDGWETRRRRTPGHDWCVVRLGVPGIVRGVDVDTSHFTGNYPEACTLEGCALDGDPEAGDLDGLDWVELLGRSPLKGDAHNRFPVTVATRVTHLRLSIHPDGGVARLRVHGEPLVDLRRVVSDCFDLAATVNGGQAVDCSDRFYSSPQNLIAVGDGRDMGDGWETRRRRGPGHDWAVVRLAAPGIVERAEIDTTNFKGNYPDRASLDACDAGTVAVPPADATWRELLPPTALGPHCRNVFEVVDIGQATHVRLNAIPDGGVARLRLHGRVTEDGWRQSGARWLEALPVAACAAELRTCCAASAWVVRMVGARPFGDFATLVEAADREWAALGGGDWLEAFAVHPRIGERASTTFSQQEQAAAAGSDAATQAALVEGNRAYEERFGHVFLICATGRSAAEILAALRERLGNDPDTELRVAAEQQRQITRLRLDKLVRPELGP